MKSNFRRIVLEAMDNRVAALLAAKASAAKPARGWLRAVRSSLGLSQQTVADRLSVTRSSYADLEASEERGAVTLNSLGKAADAMGCELVYFLVPRAGVASFAELAQRNDPDFKHLQATEHSMALEDQAVGDLKLRKGAGS
jgi:predicted DNA-binding mobile mystery protein A